MTQRTRLIAGESALTTSSGDANTLSNATCIRIWNGHTDIATVSIAKSTESGYVGIASLTMASKTVEFLEKDAQDIIWSNNAAVLAAKVAFTN